MEKVACKECGAMILPATAERTGGRCMPCKNGIRKSIEAGIAWREKDRELDRTCPFRALWRSLHERIHSRGGGLDSLSLVERRYWVLNVFEGEIFNGGFDQYFHNSSGSQFNETVDALKEIDATDALSLLQTAKQLIFSDRNVPKDTGERRQLMLSLWPGSTPGLDALDRKYWELPSRIGETLERYAVAQGLVSVAGTLCFG
ncbi:MAG: DMP19 family protein [Ahniella sp.]|nr:DMP19 family protein [Ahniella sp.]